MMQSELGVEPDPVVCVRFVIAAAVVLCCVGLLMVAARAQAAFEGVGTFGGSATPVLEEHFSEEAQLGGVGGIAVNTTGAGGVPAGTVYAATFEEVEGTVRVAMYRPNAEGTLIFGEAWVVNDFPGPYERCGPEGEPAHPHCSNRAKGGSAQRIDVEVDQATGNVYVFNGAHIALGKEYIIEYSPDGGQEITRFGEKIPVPEESTAESPEKLHDLPSPGESIAIDGAGDVYAYDDNQSSNSYRRLMVFRPQSAGDYEHYVYAGEVEAGFSGGNPELPAVDAAGHVYVVSEQLNVEEYAPAAPAPYPAPSVNPVCRFTFAKGGIVLMTVDPASGEVFFYSTRTPKSVHRLGVCDEATGDFSEISPEPEAFGRTPERGNLHALAFDPVRQIEPSRTPGVLYGGVPEPEPSERGQSALGYVFAHAKEVSPSVSGESVSNVGGTGVVLHASVDPHGFDTRYRFQFLTVGEYEGNPVGERFAGASEAPVGGGVVKGGLGVQSVAVTLGGLPPDTEYRYRVVASSECATDKVCEGSGEALGFRTFPSEPAGLPDHRVYELVSPVVKGTGEVLPADPHRSSCPIGIECKPGGTGTTRFPMQSAPDGDAIVYEGTPFSGSEGAVSENEYVARRDETKGWQTVNLTPSLLKGRGGGKYAAFDGGLSQGLLEQPGPPAITLSPEAPAEYANLYAQSTTGSAGLVPLLTVAPPNRTPANFSLAYGGQSADASRLFFSANDALTEATPVAPAAKDGGVSENDLYEWVDGGLRLVNVLPGNTETEPGASIDSANPDAHAVSTDGRRVFWSSSSGQMYVREDGERTREIPNHTARFLSASADGSRVLLSDGHVYDLETEVITDLTGGKGGFQGILGQSGDLSHVYFIDTAALTSPGEENANGEHAVGGEDNLYAWHEGATGFIATLLPADEERGGNPGDWASSPASRTAQASPDGRFVAFLSRARLTGYDNTGPCTEAGEGAGRHYVAGPCSEVFLYDSVAGRLTCASCDPSGARPLGSSVLTVLNGGGQFVEGLPQPRYLTDEGRVFFDSKDSLSPFDTNQGVEDVYEYEPKGTGALGTCTREPGCVFLISAGNGSTDSNFLSMDENAKNVFFTTRDQLALKDHDDLVDLYDAREGGGIPAETETTGNECQGEACLPPVVAPGETTPASMMFSGPGNLIPPLPTIVAPKQKKTVTSANGQKLAKALRSCRKLRKTKQRKRCEATARKRYAISAQSKTKAKSKQSSRGGK